jgi:hypothetical protein
MLRLVAISFIGAEMASAQLSPDDLNTLITRHEDGADPHEIALAISGVERALREGAEAAKLPGTIQAIDLAATIYRTHDTTVPTDRSVGRWPDFDATKFGEKPIFLGSDPTKYFTNPEATEAYKQALATHEKLLTRVSTEMHKLEEGDYCARVAFRVIESSNNPAALREKVETHIASIKDAQWVRERLTQIVLPKPRPTEQTQPQNEPSGSQATLQSQPSVATPKLQTVIPRPPKKAPPTIPTSSTPNEEPDSSNPLSVIVVLIVAAIGLLWRLLKRCL